MIDLAALTQLANQYEREMALTVPPLRIGRETFDTDVSPVIMGVVNLSQDSGYRETIAMTHESAVRKVKTAYAQGATVVDVGAESTLSSAARISSEDQINQLVPVIEESVDAGVAISVETYAMSVTRACLQAGAVVLNMTGADDETAMLELAAEYEATVVMCFESETAIRDVKQVGLQLDPIAMLADHFGPRIERAHSLGVTDIVVDPGLGFYYRNRDDRVVEARNQARVIFNSFRLKTLGVPLCQNLHHGLVFFEEQVRSGEGFFAVLGRLGGVGMFRTHEVPLIAGVNRAMDALDIEFNEDAS